MLFFQWISWFWTYFGSKNDSNYFKFRLFLNKIIVMEVLNEFSYMNKTHISVKIRKIFWNCLNKPLVSDFWDKKYRTCHRDFYSLLQLCDSNLFIFFLNPSQQLQLQYSFIICTVTLRYNVTLWFTSVCGNSLILSSSLPVTVRNSPV